MVIKPSNLASSRREFLLNVFPLGTLLCFGCGTLSAWTAGQEPQRAAEKKHKFQEDSGMLYERVFNFAFKDDDIPLLQNLAQRLKGIECSASAKSGQGLNSPKLWFSITKLSSEKRMTEKQGTSPEAIIRDIKRQTRRKFTAGGKIRIILAGLRKTTL